MNHEDSDLDGRENLAQTLAREMKAPSILLAGDSVMEVALPPDWKLQQVDREKFDEHPRRLVTAAVATTKDAFGDYVNRHSDSATSTVWCSQDPVAGKVSFRALIDDHNPAGAPSWRGHGAKFDPPFSVEWDSWIRHNKQPVSQEAFAIFLEENQADIAGGNGYPTGADMLAMALDFQAKQEQQFKSAMRLQDGGVRMEYIADADKGTIDSMKVFERFQIAIPVFRDDAVRYPIVARLRYRHPSGKLAFWYELVRPDLMFQKSSDALVDYIREKCGMPFFFGNPG